jgi:hypothetical protein
MQSRGSSCATDNLANRKSERDRALQEVNDLATQETAAIRRWKRVLLFLLFFSTVIVAAGSYTMLFREEEANYRDAVRHSPTELVPSCDWLGLTEFCSYMVQYNRFVDTIENAMRFHLQNLEGGMTRFSTIASAEARRQNSTWPMVTIPAFEIIGESVRTQTGLEIIAFCPIVTVDDVEAWESYSVSHAQEWLEESRQASLSATAKLQGSGQRTSSLVATDYEEGYPSAHILDLTSSVAEISAGAEMTFALSTQESPSGPYIPVW